MDAVVVGVVVLLLVGWVVLLLVSVVASLSPLWLGVCELECCNRLRVGLLLLVDAVVVGVVVLLLAGWVVLLPVSVVASLSPLWLGVCELEGCNRLAGGVSEEECRRLKVCHGSISRWE